MKDDGIVFLVCDSTAPDMALIDLSHELNNSTQVYPGSQKFSSCPVLTLDKDGFNVTGLGFSSHIGTHVDTPLHFIKDGACVTEVDLGLFQGPALVIDVRGKQPREKITWHDLQPYESEMQRGKIVVLYTGWSVYWKSPKYIDHPFLDRTAAEGLMKAGIRTVGVDTMSPDETFQEGTEVKGDFCAHKIILSAGAVIAENLTNIDHIASGNYVVSLLPLKLTDCDASPVRAVAWSTVGCN